VPEDLFGGFLRVLAARSDELALLRGRELPPPSKWDTHPPFPERLAALSTSDDAGLAADDDGELVPDLPGLARALQAVAYPPQGRTPVDWDGFFGAARTAEMEREARGALSALSRTGTAVTCVGDLLDLAADGRLSKVAEETFPGLPAEETTARIGELVTLLLALAVLRGGAARWRHSWTGTAELVTPDGGHLDLGALAALATEPATVAAARERLAELGVDPYAAVTGDAARGNAVHGDAYRPADRRHRADPGARAAAGAERFREAAAGPVRRRRPAGTGRRRAGEPLPAVRRSGRRHPDPAYAEELGSELAGRWHPNRTNRAGL
jgi:hypothetical protein